MKPYARRLREHLAESKRLGRPFAAAWKHALKDVGRSDGEPGSAWPHRETLGLWEAAYHGREPVMRDGAAVDAPDHVARGRGLAAIVEREYHDPCARPDADPVALPCRWGDRDRPCSNAPVLDAEGVDENGRPLASAFCAEHRDRLRAAYDAVEIKSSHRRDLARLWERRREAALEEPRGAVAA